MSDKLISIERIIKEAQSLPRIDLPPDGWDPTKEELARNYARLAMAYATSTALLQQALPIIVGEIHALRDELRVRDLTKYRERRPAKTLGKARKAGV